MAHPKQKEYSRRWYLKNKEKVRGYTRKWYAANRERRREITNASARRRLPYVLAKQKERKEKAVELLGGKCVDCGGVFPPVCYDFHHLEDKKYNPSKVVRQHKWETALEELKKCILLCSNCHRIRTWNDRTTEASNKP